MGEQKRRGAGTFSIVTVVTLCMIGAVLVWSMWTKTPTTVKFPGGGEIHIDQLEANQSAQQKQVETLKVEAAQQQSQTPDSQVPNVAGRWVDNSGFIYSFNQYGQHLVVQVLWQQYTVAAGQGTVGPTSVQFDTQTFMGYQYSYRLDYYGAGQLNGTAVVTDPTGGRQTYPVALQRL